MKKTVAAELDAALQEMARNLEIEARSLSKLPELPRLPRLVKPELRAELLDSALKRRERLKDARKQLTPDRYRELRARLMELHRMERRLLYTIGRELSRQSAERRTRLLRSLGLDPNELWEN